jgi:tryptophan-rich sensory protein
VSKTSNDMDFIPAQSRAQSSPWAPWLIAIAAVSLTLAAGALFAPGDWYETLRKPSWQPPGWVFGPVWTSLYVMLGVALALLLKTAASAERQHALIWFAIQLVLNAAWTPLFFGLQSPVLAFINICLLWGAMLISIMAAFRVSTASAWLQVPTLIWVSFALVLNGVIVAMNL